MPFICTICEQESTRICVSCTKDTCNNHLCVKCTRCSDCCACELALDESETVHPPEPQAPAPEPPIVDSPAEPPDSLGPIIDEPVGSAT